MGVGVMVSLVRKDRAYWIDWHLQNWARWMRGDERPDGLPEQACSGVTGYTTLGNSEIAYERMDAELADATNAAIEGLESPAEQCAIYRAYDIVAVFHMRDYGGALAMAKLHVADSLERRGVWLGG